MYILKISKKFTFFVATLLLLGSNPFNSLDLKHYF